MRKWITGAVFLLTTSLHAGENKIQIMMTVPRTVSTAFEKSMMARGDHKVFHEPWSSMYIYNLGYNNQGPPQEVMEARTYEGIKELVYQYAEKKPVFIKDMIWAIERDILEDESLLADPNVIFTILIRDPLLSIESFFLKISERLPVDHAVSITRRVFRYDALVALAHTYHAQKGVWPIVIEAEDVCAKPEATMQMFCKQAGIAYKEEALEWQTGLPEEWMHTAKWHLDAAASKGFFIPTRKVGVHFSQVPEEVRMSLETLYQEQKPFYEELKALKSAF